jgi:hypothetical protein
VADLKAALRSDLRSKDAIMLQKLGSISGRIFVRCGIIPKHQWNWFKPKYFTVFTTMKVYAEDTMQK